MSNADRENTNRENTNRENDAGYPASDSQSENLEAVRGFIDGGASNEGSVYSGIREIAEVEDTGRSPLLSDNNLNLDGFDERLYAELYEASASLREAVGEVADSLRYSENAEDSEAGYTPADNGGAGHDRTSERVRSFEELLEDVWGAYYRHWPVLREREEVSDIGLGGRYLFEEMVDSPATREARVYTGGDELSAAVSTLAAAGELSRRFVEDSDTAPEPPATESGEPKEESGRGDGPEGESRGEGVDPRGSTEGDGSTDDAAAGSEAESNKQRLQARAARAASERAREEAEDLEKDLSGWGLASADLCRAPGTLAERLEVAEKLRSQEMRGFAQRLGRLRSVVRSGRRERVQGRPGVLSRMDTGASPEDLLAEDCAALGDGASRARRLDFYRRLIEGSLPRYAEDSRDEVGRGPLVIMVDASGSMGGEKMQRASAAALALAAECRRGKRPRRVLVAHFNARVVSETLFDVAPGSRIKRDAMADARGMLDVATVSASGGTDYMPPLRRAVAVIEGECGNGETADFRRSDVALITDAICETGEDFEYWFSECKEESNFRMHAVLIGGGADEGRAKRSLGGLADRIWIAEDLEDSVIKQMAGSVDEGGLSEKSRHSVKRSSGSEKPTGEE